MKTMTAATAAVLLAAFGLATGSALADGRAPNAEEATRVSAALNKLGFSSWQKVELESNKWDVDDAKHSDGKVYDVDLALTDFSVLKREIDVD